jgi:hypothetical protein
MPIMSPRILKATKNSGTSFVLQPKADPPLAENTRVSPDWIKGCPYLRGGVYGKDFDYLLFPYREYKEDG